MTTKLLIPLLNSSVKTYKGPPLYLSDTVSIETITPEDFTVILSNSKSTYKSLITPKSKCVKVDNIDPQNVIETGKIESSKISFLLNFFKKNNPISLSFVVQLSKVKKSKFDKIFDLPIISDAHFQNVKTYSIKDDVKRDIISKFYKVISIVHEKYPGLILTINRFNSALYRLEPHDKIIDITICLESLIRGNTEVRHKFSLFNSWAAEGIIDNRKETYDLLMGLYDARSAIVHGAAMTEKDWNKRIKPILDNWIKILEITEKAIAYHILFIHDNNIEDWYKHQENIALGIEKRAAF